ncbi:MAG: nucleotidyltransferase domain-containing protein [Candidatus Brocadiales bacterium]|nr:nucleotidyltransferase domain-containing protein [Candidatus Brocadiales bacterium]
MKNIHLASLDQQALQQFVAYLYNTVSGEVKHIALFGSKARGDSQRGSDIDVLVILQSEDRELRRKIIRQAARISLEYDVLLSPRVIGAERWNEMRGFSLYQNVEKEAADLEIVGGELSLGMEREGLSVG